MFIINCINKIRYGNRFLVPAFIFSHTQTCPTKHRKHISKPTNGGPGPLKLKRALNSGPVRLAIFPEEWFLFFHGKTGVSGPYILGICLSNYLLSKEIYVIEHEYYVGLSILVVIYYVKNNLGPSIAQYLDKEVDAHVNNMENLRKAEMNVFEQQLKVIEDAQWRAQGQKILMDAKKENIVMQLEAAYRERLMQAFRAVKGRLNYQQKFYHANNRIQQKWMIEWIINQVKKSINPDFEKRVFDSAIQQIADAAGRVK